MAREEEEAEQWCHAYASDLMRQIDELAVSLSPQRDAWPENREAILRSVEAKENEVLGWPWAQTVRISPSGVVEGVPVLDFLFDGASQYYSHAQVLLRVREPEFPALFGSAAGRIMVERARSERPPGIRERLSDMVRRFQRRFKRR